MATPSVRWARLELDKLDDVAREVDAVCDSYMQLVAKNGAADPETMKLRQSMEVRVLQFERFANKNCGDKRVNLVEMQRLKLKKVLRDPTSQAVEEGDTLRPDYGNIFATPASTRDLSAPAVDVPSFVGVSAAPLASANANASSSSVPDYQSVPQIREPSTREPVVRDATRPAAEETRLSRNESIRSEGRGLPAAGNESHNQTHNQSMTIASQRQHHRGSRTAVREFMVKLTPEQFEELNARHLQLTQEHSSILPFAVHPFLRRGAGHPVRPKRASAPSAESPYLHSQGPYVDQTWLDNYMRKDNKANWVDPRGFQANIHPSTSKLFGDEVHYVADR